MPLLTLSMGTVHYRDAGDGPPVVLLHANPGDSRDFEAVFPQLSTIYRVVALDWPGYGSSSIPARPDSVDVLLCFRTLLEFIATLALPPAVFVGNSLGGNAAARLACAQPQSVRGLVLVSPGGFTSPNFITRAFCMLQGSALAIAPHRLASWYLKRRTPTARAMLDRAKAEQSIAPRLSVNRALWRSFARSESDLRSVANAITAPTLLMFGSRDPVIPARTDGQNAARSIPGARFVSLPCGHAPFAEEPDRFMAEVVPFIARCFDA